jgi:predicted Zn-dependent peptidase
VTRSTKTRKGGSAYRKATLKNGLRVVTEQLPGVRSISIGVWIDVGSRCERTDEGGLSHFIEHLVFKGTRRRSARQIAGSLESIGGNLNAFTTREHTCFTARVLDEHLVDAIDVLADITCHATLTEANMDRERGVICEEIRESLDNPADHIHDLFAATHWNGNSLGRPILGTEDLIKSVPRKTLKSYFQRNYRAGSVVIAACGSVSHNRLVKLVRDKFAFAEGERDPLEAAERPAGSRVKLTPGDSSQTQFCVGFPGLAYDNPDKLALMLLTSYLGGGMSSVLFQKIREQRGLAYSVFAYNDYYRDAGIFGVYLGTDQSHLRQAFDLILGECRRLKKRKMTTANLDKVKAQVKGHLTLGMESTTSRMHRLGRQEIVMGAHQTLGNVLKAIEKVSVEDILRTAHRVLIEDQITIAALGPVDPKLFDDVG